VSGEPSFHSSLELADSVVLPEPEVGPERCLGPTDVIESDDPEIREKAASLVAGLSTDGERARALFEFVRDSIPYDFTPTLRSRADWSGLATLRRGYGFCQQKALLLAALCRAADLPCSIAFQRIVDHKLLDTRFERVLPGGIITFHGYNHIWLGGEWRPADATLDARLCAKRGYRLTELEPRDRGRLPLTDLSGAPHFDIVKEMGPFADMPRTLTDLAVSLQESWEDLKLIARRTGATM
jgi:transglutaminase-like putative cysteine protease